MQIGMNYATKKFHDDVIKLANESGLPAVNVRYVLSDILYDVKKLEDDLIASEKDEYFSRLAGEKNGE